MSNEATAGAVRSEDRELVRDAFERGIFGPPSDVTVEDVAAEAGLTEREARRRLARGLAIVLKEYRDETDEGDVQGLFSED